MGKQLSLFQVNFPEHGEDMDPEKKEIHLKIIETYEKIIKNEQNTRS